MAEPNFAVPRSTFNSIAPPDPARHLDRILRRPQVEFLTGLPTSSLYDAIRQGRFPQPIKLSVRSVGWPESAVLAWLSARPVRQPAGR
ncbi:MAG: AlpA family phage regulatory protein [Magnetococcales bacterium]|nr:AlpA family phage regulatory protein [Magnetococcales bacterium]